MNTVSGVLTDAAKYPAALEAALPIPKVSAFLKSTAAKFSSIPAFPFNIPAGPTPPVLPKLGTGAATSKLKVEEQPGSQSSAQVPIQGPLPQVIATRGM
jgi:hypothetical protein